MDYRNPVIVLAMAVGGVISRYHGGWNFVPTIGKVWKGLLFALPIAAMCTYPDWDIFTFAAVLALVAAAKNTGHGQWYSLAHVWKRIKPERLDFIVSWFFGPDPRATLSEDIEEYYVHPYDNRLYWRCVFGMCLKGIAIVVPTVPFLGPWMLLAGLLSMIGYVIGWRLYPTNTVNGEFVGIATAIGEVVNGIVIFGACALALLVV